MICNLFFFIYSAFEDKYTGLQKLFYINFFIILHIEY